MIQQPLLTIAIPTYNRARLLDRCLHYFISQLETGCKSEVEFIVSDNASKDNTTEIVTKYINNGVPIKYYRNDENKGPGRNIGDCFLKATGKYVWVFSDDDFILPGYLPRILSLLRNNDLGNIYINSLWYVSEQTPSSEKPVNMSYEMYLDPIKFVEKVNYWSTFISGNIINKSSFPYIDQISEFCDSFLVQLSWILPTIFIGKPNVVINDKAVACLSNNTGGYKLVEVFGTNLNHIVDQLVLRRQIDGKVKRIINSNLIRYFFPMFISRDQKFENENAMKILLPIYWLYRPFWTGIFPKFAKGYVKGLIGK